MIPLILPVISGEEDRGVWSSNKKQKKSLQVDQEGGFRQRSNILGFSPGSEFGENGGTNRSNQSKGKQDELKQIHVQRFSRGLLVFMLQFVRLR